MARDDARRNVHGNKVKGLLLPAGMQDRKFSLCGCACESERVPFATIGTVATIVCVTS